MASTAITTTAQAHISVPLPLAEAPAELTRSRLCRLGEGIGKVVYASDHWVVKRDRSPAEIIALIAIWKFVRRLERFLPRRLRGKLLDRPSRQIRFLRMLVQSVVAVIPRALWYMTHIGQVWRLYHDRSTQGEALAQEKLTGTHLIPERICFPPTRVSVAGWPGWLTVEEATERVEATLHARLSQLAASGAWEEVELWLNRLLELRQAGWARGLFSLDAHLKNFGVTSDRVVLLDTGGLTDSWEEIEKRLGYEEDLAEPHIQLGLGPILRARPDIAHRFNQRWKALVNRLTVRKYWPEA